MNRKNEISLLTEDSNYFLLFKLPVAFEVDQVHLKAAFFDLLAQNHPDRFANSPQELKDASLKNSIIINAGYKTLRSKRLRLSYLLDLFGLDRSQNITLDEDFLEQNFLIRHNFSQAQSIDALQRIHNELKANEQTYYTDIAKILAEKLYTEAIDVYIKLKFLHKMIEEVEQLIELREFENEII